LFFIHLTSRATEAVASSTGDTIGGLLNATLGNLTELMVAITALKAGHFMLVKASIAGAIVTNSLFQLGARFFLGGIRHHLQVFNREAAHMQSGLKRLGKLRTVGGLEREGAAWTSNRATISDSPIRGEVLIDLQ
jgi:Ca2+:H+ antiporter